MTITVPLRIAQIHLNSDTCEFEVEASTAREAIEKLGEIIPFHKPALKEGILSRWVAWLLNDVNILELDGLDTVLKEGDVLEAVGMTSATMGVM